MQGMIEFLHDEIGMFFEFLYFYDFGEVAIVCETEHDLKLFLNEDDFL